MYTSTYLLQDIDYSVLTEFFLVGIVNKANTSNLHILVDGLVSSNHKVFGLQGRQYIPSIVRKQLLIEQINF